MTIWIDAQLSPAIAVWLTLSFSVTTLAVRGVGLRDAENREIFLDARRQSAVVLTKDSDFVLLQDELGAPPKVIWLTCGNTSNTELKRILSATLSEAVNFLESGEDLVEIKANF